MSSLHKSRIGMTKLEADFWAFHQANPRVYEYLCRFAGQAIARGRRRLGIAMLYERVRWEVFLETTDEEFKLNNNHRAYFARLWLREHPDYPLFFTTRRVRGSQVEISPPSWYFNGADQGELFS
jgi:hypothetical protein